MSQPSPHDTYMGMVFRPMIMPNGDVKRVAVQLSSPACFDPECFPNLITAAPVMYQALCILKSKFAIGSTDREFIESIMYFAIEGYTAQSKIDQIINKMKGA